MVDLRLHSAYPSSTSELKCPLPTNRHHAHTRDQERNLVLNDGEKKAKSDDRSPS